MTQERIYLTLQKEPGKPAQVVDQHGRRLVVRSVSMDQSYDGLNLLRLELFESTAQGEKFSGMQAKNFVTSEPKHATPSAST